MVERYKDSKYIHQISLNCPEWAIPVTYEAVAQPTLYKSFLRKTPRFLYVAIGLALLAVLYLGVKCLGQVRARLILKSR